MKAALWARVSTLDQHAENQVTELREWAQRRGLEITQEFVTEDSAWQNGGRNGKGTEFDTARAALLDGARLGRYTVVLAWSIDRLSRRGIEDTLAALRRLSKAGCTVWSLKEPWAEDLRDPRMRELFVSIAAWMAEMESARRSERIRAGLARRRREGKTLGGRAKGSRNRRPRPGLTGEAAGWTAERSAALAELNKQRAALRKEQDGEAEINAGPIPGEARQ